MGASNMTATPGRWWRRFTILAGLLLASTLFMPVASCTYVAGASGGVSWTQYFHETTVFTPVKELVSLPGTIAGYLPSATTPDIAALALSESVGWGFGGAVGAVAAVAAFVRSFGRQRPRALGDVTLAGLVIVAAIAVPACAIEQAMQTAQICRLLFSPRWPWVITDIVLPLLALVYAVRAMRRGVCAGPCASFLGGTLTAAWGVRWGAVAVQFSGFAPPAWSASCVLSFGYYVLLAAAFALMFFAVGEARAIGGRTWAGALRAVLTASVKPRPGNECEQCGYLLIGLPEPRCPECGTPFDPAMLGSMNAAAHASSATAVAATNT